MLSATRHFVRITLFIACTPLPPEAHATEHVFRYKLIRCTGGKMKTATAKVRSGGITQNIERECACFQVKYSQVCITRAAVNENVCEDSHTEHV